MVRIPSMGIPVIQFVHEHLGMTSHPKPMAHSGDSTIQPHQSRPQRIPLPKNWLLRKDTSIRHLSMFELMNRFVVFQSEEKSPNLFLHVWNITFGDHQLHVFFYNIDLQHDYFCIASATTMLPCNVFIKVYQRMTLLLVNLSFYQLSLGQPEIVEMIGSRLEMSTKPWRCKLEH